MNVDTSESSSCAGEKGSGSLKRDPVQGRVRKHYIVKYIAAMAMSFIIVSIFWSIADIEVYSYSPPEGRWQGYAPKLWPYLFTNVAVLIGIVIISTRKFGVRMMIPALYAFVAGYYFYRMQTHPREPDDMILIRPFYSLVALLVMGLSDIASVVFLRLTGHHSSRAVGKGVLRRLRIAAVACMFVCTFVVWFFVRGHVVKEKFLDRLRFCAGVPELIQRINDPDAATRRTAAFALASPHFSEDQSVVPILIKLSSNSDERIRECAIGGLHDRQSPEAFETIIRATRDPSGRVRQETVDSLEDSQDPRCSKILASMLDDPDEGVRALAAGALAKHKEALPIARLIELTKSDDDFCRAQAAMSLGVSSAPEAYQVLVNLLSDPDDGVKYQAIESLGKYGDPRAVPLIEAMLHDKTYYVRQQAPQALGDIHHPESFAALTRMLSNPDYMVRYLAVEGLAKIDPDRALPFFKKALTDPDDSVRFNTVCALGLCSQPEVVDALLPMLHDPEASVRRETVGSLIKLKAVDALDSIQELKGDPDDLVRRYVNRAVGELGTGTENGEQTYEEPVHATNGNPHDK